MSIRLFHRASHHAATLTSRLRYQHARGGRDEHGEQVWFGGGRLGDDVTLPRLHKRWAGDPGQASYIPDISDAERQAIIDDAAAVAGMAAEQIRLTASIGAPRERQGLCRVRA